MKRFTFAALSVAVCVFGCLTQSNAQTTDVWKTNTNGDATTHTDEEVGIGTGTTAGSSNDVFGKVEIQGNGCDDRVLTLTARSWNVSNPSLTCTGGIGDGSGTTSGADFPQLFSIRTYPTLLSYQNDEPTTLFSFTPGGYFGINTGQPRFRLQINALSTEDAFGIYNPAGSSPADDDPLVADNLVFKITGEGHVYAQKINVVLAPFPDYVFSPTYRLRPLSELSDFITENRHLPGLPTAETVESDGADLGELTRTLVEKVEELTLYTLQQQAEIERLQAELNELKDEDNE